jgi:uncharacterized alpha-E superfamily protein
MFNPVFPKSIAYNLEVVHQNILRIAFHDQTGTESLNFKAGKLASQFKYMTIEETEKEVTEFLSSTLEKINTMATLLVDKHLIY